MLVVKLNSGLGNQLFMYAFSLYLKQETNREVFFELSSFTTDSSNRKIEIDILFEYFPIAKFYWSYTGPNKLKAKIYHKLGNIIPFTSVINDNNIFVFKNDLPKNVIFNGYWQTEYYINRIKNIKEKFIPKEIIPNELYSYKETIFNSKKSVSLHIRRGDFFSSRYVDRYAVCTKKYYESALNYLIEKFDNFDLFVFSDDINWVKENIFIPNKIIVTYIPNLFVNNFWYINLMSLCNHNIISNSSFSWWGAYLNEFQEKCVIAPARWTLGSLQTLALDSWVKLDC